MRITFNRIKKYHPCAEGWEEGLSQFDIDEANKESMDKLIEVAEIYDFENLDWLISRVKMLNPVANVAFAYYLDEIPVLTAVEKQKIKNAAIELKLREGQSSYEESTSRISRIEQFGRSWEEEIKDRGLESSNFEEVFWEITREYIDLDSLSFEMAHEINFVRDAIRIIQKDFR